MDRPEPDTRSSAETEDQIRAVVAGVRSVLGADLVGVYLHGSGVLGGFRQDSDIDVLVVSTRHTIAEEKQHLVHLLLSISGSGAAVRPGRPIELSIVVWSEVRPWRYPPRFDFHYSELWRGRFERGEIEPWDTTSDRDLASAITMVLLGDRALAGPPPGEVFDPVPRGDYVDAVLRDIYTVDEYLPWDARNVVLTLPRIWSAIATDAVLSKEDAATWALPRLPEEHRGVLELARAAYRGDTKDSWDDLGPEARAYADHVVSEIDRALSEADHPM